jgi:hypothetical protein
LAKLQILKQNTEPPSTSSTKEVLQFNPERPEKGNEQQQHLKRFSDISANKTNNGSRDRDKERSKHSKGGTNSYEIQQAKLHSVDDFVVGQSYKFCNSSKTHKVMDSGKSSDSSLSSANNYNRINEGGSLRIGSSNSKSVSRYLSGNAYKLFQEGSIKPPPEIASSNSKQSHLGTPGMKKKLQYESQMPGKSKENSKSSNHQSFDYTSPSTNITRSGSFMSSPVSGSSSRHLPMTQRKGSFDGHGSDDSMHEKYFKSVENTPVSRRRHTTTSKTGIKSSDSSPQSPISPQKQVLSLKIIFSF